ncbi:MAG: TonB-dependent receptor [Acidobacteriota bacterium]|nr:TonB-dependent receptor [Acidobacteriota bacterium]
MKHFVPKLGLAMTVAVTALAQTSAPPPSQNPIPPLQTTVTVNGTISAESPAAITVLNQQQIQETPGTELDDRLRQVPGFSLFRRSSSMVANPTTQGVSLRGTGSTGASRTLLLWDGIPINDPFGGWVYWDRLDPYFIDRVEIDRGAATSVFGDRAMSGTISLFSPPEQHEHISADFIGGSQGTEDVSGAYSNLWGRWGLSVHSREFTTDGYYIVPESLRGTADDKANVRFATGDVHVDYLGTTDRLSIHFDALAEERHNGTLLTHNSTGLGTLGVTYTHSWANDQISVIGFHTEEQFHSTFSSVSLGRNTEKLASKQTVPEYDVGGAAYWRHHAKHWNTIIGADTDDIHGTSFDYSYSTHVLMPSGGMLLEHGTFGQGDITLGHVQFFAGIRQQFTGHEDTTFVSPNGGIALGLRRFRLRASGYRSFRAPTLNELYRNFRVGNALTTANAALVPEGLVGVEAGVDWIGETTHISAGVFRNDLNNLIDNATLSTSKTLILRQRGNFPSALSRGFEANLTQSWRRWRLDAGYLFADARLSTGERIPEVPKQQGTAQLTYAAKSTLLSFGVRSFGLQFDDDLNQFKLPGYAALNATAERHITSKLSALATVENLLDRSFLVALTPTPNTGEPRLWRVGLRWSGSIH